MLVKFLRNSSIKSSVLIFTMHFSPHEYTNKRERESATTPTGSTYNIFESVVVVIF